MRETIELGSCPADESCAQVGTDNYSERARKECHVYKRQLLREVEKQFGYNDLDCPVQLSVKGNAHDFGTYYEVCVRFNEDDDEESRIAYWLEGDSLTCWDAQSRSELDNPIE